MKDRMVEHPNRYRLIPVEGESGVYDLEMVPGEVTEWGTPYNKANLLSDETAELYGGAETVNEALNRGTSLASYIAFCGDKTPDTLDAAFGKNNEDRVMIIGKQMCMYAWFAGESAELNPYPHLFMANKFRGVCSDPYCLAEITDSQQLQDLIHGSPWAGDLFDSSLRNVDMLAKVLAIREGLNPDDYDNFTSLLNDSFAMTLICNNANSIELIVTSTTAFTAAANSSTAMECICESSISRLALYENYIITAPIIATSNIAIAAMEASTQFASISGNFRTGGSPSSLLPAYDGKVFILTVTSTLPGTFYHGYYVPTGAIMSTNGTSISPYSFASTVGLYQNIGSGVTLTVKILKI